MKKNLLMGLVCPIMALASVAAPVFAAASDVPSQQTTQVEYNVVDTGTDPNSGWITTNWVWEVPAAQTFNDGTLSLNGTVAIKPAVEGKVLVLDDGKTIDITLRSGNGFELQNTAKSSIDYQVKKHGEENALTQDANVLNFTAGTSTNTGVSQVLDFVTSSDNLKAAKLTGAHIDTITFTVTAS